MFEHCISICVAWSAVLSLHIEMCDIITRITPIDEFRRDESFGAMFVILINFLIHLSRFSDLEEVFTAKFISRWKRVI